MFAKLRYMLGKFFSTDGRINRCSLLINLLILYLFFCILEDISTFFIGNFFTFLRFFFSFPGLYVRINAVVMVLIYIVYFLLGLKAITLYIRRAHDVGNGFNGKWFGYIIPIVSFILFVKIFSSDYSLSFSFIGIFILMFVKVTTSVYVWVPLLLIKGKLIENRYGLPDERNFNNDGFWKSINSFFSSSPINCEKKLVQNKVLSSKDILSMQEQQPQGAADTNSEDK